MTQLYRNKITDLNSTEFEVHKYTAEASSLGIPPGYWPAFIETSLGNGLAFLFSGTVRHGGEIVGARYTQDCGCISITIFND